MKIIYLTLFVCLGLVGCGPAPQGQMATAAARTAKAQIPSDPRLVRAPDSSFTFTAPAGWQVKDTGVDYPALIGPQLDNYNLNLVFFEESSDLALAAYAARIQDNLAVTDPNLQKVSESTLTTDGGQTFYRREVETNREGVAYHLVLYFFASGDWKLSVTYTRPAEAGAQYDTAVDAAMKSVHFERK